MYLPATFGETRRDVLFDFIETYGFATLISAGGIETQVSHVPLLLDRSGGDGGRLIGHVARANPHWRAFDGAQTALAIFHGPHAYVSPSWYVTTPSVPTWNYAVVHVYGRPRTLDAGGTREVLRRLVETYESKRKDRWS